MTETAVLNIIDKIALKLAVPATDILNAYAASGIRNVPSFIVSIMLVMLSFVFLCWATYLLVVKNVELAGLNVVISGIFLFGSLAFMGSTIGPILLWFSNPKAYAIMTIMETLTK